MPDIIGTALPIKVTRIEWEIIHTILQSLVPGNDVWAFGSRVDGTAKPYSDLDLALAGSEEISLPRRAALAEAFEHSELPFRVDLIDLLNVEKAFAERVRRVGALIQSRQK